MKKAFAGLFFLFFSLSAYSQNGSEAVQGKVSFISTQNVYVKFQSTTGLSVGDTLFSLTGTKKNPVMIIRSLSSTSCACTNLAPNTPVVGDSMIAVRKPDISASSKKTVEKETRPGAPPAAKVTDPAKSKVIKKSTQRIRGSISAISYSNFSKSNTTNSNQFRYNFSLDARNIANSRFSAETYISFRHKDGEWNSVKNNIFSALKIYNLAVSYDPSKTTHISLGRKINPEISGIGAVDGIQAEKSIGKFFIGGLAGFRPDYADYGFNPDLLEYGGWLGFRSEGNAGYFRNTLAVVQQTNNGQTDRRFLSFNLSSSIANKISLLGSFEADLFELKDSLPKSAFNPTAYYFSLRYRITDNLSLSGSYDSRKNIIYYESFKSFIDLAVENEMRKSFRLSANYRITDNMVFGLDAGYRYLKSDPVQSKNANGYFTYTNIPWVNITATISGTYLESGYLNGKIFSATITKDLFQSHLQLSGGYRYIDYNFIESLQNSLQNIAEGNLTWQFLKTMSLSVNYELTFEDKNKYNRIYVQIRKRF